MLPRTSTKTKLLVAILICVACAFIINLGGKVFVGEIKELVQKTSEESEMDQIMKWIKSWIPSSSEVILWMDIPSDFPWRHCLEEYNGIITLLPCTEHKKSQIFYLEAVPRQNNKTIKSFLWKMHDGRCIVPGKAVHEQKIWSTLVVSTTCNTGYWIWTSQGQMTWSEGCAKCVTSMKENTLVAFTFCRELSEDQNVEIGEYHTENGRSVLRPRDVKEWEIRQAAIRNEQLSSNKVVVTKALEEIDKDDLMHVGGFKGERRRAAVFYLDSGKGGIAHVNWWIYTWRFIGLNASEEAFDIVIMAHPEAVTNIPEDCKEIGGNHVPHYGQPGECLYNVYVGIAYRDNSFDSYMNSQECLFGPGSQFLAHYKVLLRADLDTFPTPRLLGFWPEGVIADKGYQTMMGKESIKEALRQLACAVGIDHQEWFNIGSSWYGDGRRVRNLAKLTVALNKFGRAHMFGPGTPCRCADCVVLPKDCEWGGGPYPGVLLLYLQEIAINKLLTPDEWDTLPPGVLDQGVTNRKTSICEPGVLHCMQNAEDFSKIAFAKGKYTDYDMAELDMTKTPDYAMFMALTSSKQGKNGDIALDNLYKKIGNSSLSDYCKEKDNH